MDASNKPETDHHSENEVDYWLKIKREAGPASLTPLEDAAKQIVVITSLLQGIYFAAISFSGVKQVGSLSNVWFNVFVLLTVMTVVCWMLSLYFATRVFVPETYKRGLKSTEWADQAIEVRDAYEKIAINKHNKLTTAAQFLWFSFVPFGANVIIYLVFLPAPPVK